MHSLTRELQENATQPYTLHNDGPRLRSSSARVPKRLALHSSTRRGLEPREVRPPRSESRLGILAAHLLSEQLPQRISVHLSTLCELDLRRVAVWVAA